MSTRKLSPATTQDLRSLEGRLTKHFDGKISDAITDSEKRIMRYFDVAVEAIRHDLEGANKDGIELIKDDIVRLKRHTGLIPA
jgi:hypothetical protein